MDKSKIVVIKSFPTTGEALIYQALLESSGINCQLINAVMSDVLPLQNELLNVKLVVSEQDADKAREMLAAKFDEQEFETESMKRRKKP